MLDRRSLFARIVGGAVAAKVGLGETGRVTLRDAEEVAGVTADLGVPMPPKPRRLTDDGKISWWDLWDKIEPRSNHRPDNLPPHIGAMKSWSPVFKWSVYDREEDLKDILRKEIMRDRKLMMKVAKRVGITADQLPDPDNTQWWEF